MTDEEDMTAELLRLAGAPPDPSSERTARVLEAVYREWRVGRRRRVVRRGAAIALLGAAASLTIAVWTNHRRPVTTPGDGVVATGQRALGQPVIVRQSQHPGAPQLLRVSSGVYPGDLIQTDDTSRVALLASDGSSVRIDRASRLRFLAPSVIEVLAGAAYVATADGSHGFEIRTTWGAVRDVGTQFEIRLDASSLRLRVRSGKVELGRGATITTAEAGTETMVTTTGVVVRRMPAYGSEWAWTTDVAPGFAIEGRTLAAFLEHLAREEGWTLQYADAAVAASAGRTILHGSIEGLRAEDALGVALATSGLQHRLSSGELLVSRAGEAQ